MEQILVLETKTGKTQTAKLKTIFKPVFSMLVYLQSIIHRKFQVQFGEMSYQAWCNQLALLSPPPINPGGEREGMCGD